jgi:type IV secretory pathway VirD2 relaxase
VIKTRVVRLKKVGKDAIAAHLRYIARDGAGRDIRSAALPYDATTDGVDLDKFQARGANDRHQFRFIIAPEDAAEIGDLRAFTRSLMDRVANDLATPLNWVAVDHWDTDNPHTHVVLLGRDASGNDLVIAGEYIAIGMRVRASELATSWLGPRTDAEMQLAVGREVEAERWTSLDRELKSAVREGRVEIHPRGNQRDALRRRALLIGRLRYLQTMDLAELDSTGSWRLREDAEQVLRRLGERGDIIRTMQRAFGKEQRQLAVFDPASSVAPVVGRVTAKGLMDELGDRSFLVIDGVDGRGHYVPLPSSRPLAELPIGGIVEVRPATERAVDRNMVAASANGLYLPKTHMHQLRAAGTDRDLAADIVDSHVRRLEALRRAGIVERVADGLWRIPTDLVARGVSYDRQRHGGMSLHLRCHLSIEHQIRAIGVTWLDHQLCEGARPSTAVGFAVSVKDALKSREDFLVEKGLAQREASLTILNRDLLTRLRETELTTAGKALATELGRSYRRASDGVPVSGTYRRSVQLTSGRFAMLDDGLGFRLVPWKPVIEKQLGRSISATMRGEHVVWHLGRSRTPSIS